MELAAPVSMSRIACAGFSASRAPPMLGGLSMTKPSLKLAGTRLARSLASSKSSRRFRLQVSASKQQTFSSFEDMIQNSDRPVLVDFYATWCGPCQYMVPILGEVGSTMKDEISVVKIDTEKYPVLANKYNIEALPTIVLFKDGEPIDRLEGVLPAAKLVDRIRRALESCKDKDRLRQAN